MNERIRELAEQACFDEIGKDYSLYFNLTKDKVEKFAELIVQACLKEIKDMLVDESEKLYPNNKQTTECVNERLLDAHDNISALFGVEE
jgi:hypothetical protein